MLDFFPKYEIYYGHQNGCKDRKQQKKIRTTCSSYDICYHGRPRTHMQSRKISRQIFFCPQKGLKNAPFSMQIFISYMELWRRVF